MLMWLIIAEVEVWFSLQTLQFFKVTLAFLCYSNAPSANTVCSFSAF